MPKIFFKEFLNVIKYPVTVLFPPIVSCFVLHLVCPNEDPHRVYTRHLVDMSPKSVHSSSVCHYSPPATPCTSGAF